MKAMQDYYSEEYAPCYGRGSSTNPHSRHLKSYGDDAETVARFTTLPMSSDGYFGLANGETAACRASLLAVIRI